MFCYTAAGPYDERRNDAQLMQKLVGSRSVGCNFLEGWHGEPTFCGFFTGIDHLFNHLVYASNDLPLPTVIRHR